MTLHPVSPVMDPAMLSPAATQLAHMLRIAVALLLPLYVRAVSPLYILIHLFSVTATVSTCFHFSPYQLSRRFAKACLTALVWTFGVNLISNYAMEGAWKQLILTYAMAWDAPTFLISSEDEVVPQYSPSPKEYQPATLGAALVAPLFVYLFGPYRSSGPLHFALSRAVIWATAAVHLRKLAFRALSSLKYHSRVSPGDTLHTVVIANAFSIYDGFNQSGTSFGISWLIGRVAWNFGAVVRLLGSEESAKADNTEGKTEWTKSLVSLGVTSCSKGGVELFEVNFTVWTVSWSWMLSRQGVKKPEPLKSEGKSAEKITTKMAAQREEAAQTKGSAKKDVPKLASAKKGLEKDTVNEATPIKITLTRATPTNTSPMKDSSTKAYPNVEETSEKQQIEEKQSGNLLEVPKKGKGKNKKRKNKTGKVGGYMIG